VEHSAALEAPRHHDAPLAARRDAIRLAQVQDIRRRVAVDREVGGRGEIGVVGRGIARARKHLTLRVEHEDRSDMRNARKLVAHLRHHLARAFGPHRAQDEVDRFERRRGLLGDEPRHVGEIAQHAPLVALVGLAHIPDRRADIDRDEQQAERDQRAAERDAGERRAQSCGRHRALT
jgi:hypothetical protein